MINRSMNLLYPPFRVLLQMALDDARRQGLPAYLFEGTRLGSRQLALWNQGRTTPGQIVTWARPGSSTHEYGVGGDVVFDGDVVKPGIQWSWEGGYADKNGDRYDKFAKIAKGYGLEWLGDSNIERAHFQKTWGLSVQDMKKIADTEGVLGVWAKLDTLSGG